MYYVTAWCDERVDWITLIETPNRKNAFSVFKIYADLEYYSIIDVLQRKEDGYWHLIDGWMDRERCLR